MSNGLLRTRGLIFNDRDELLLAHTGHNGYWCAPGGRTEPGETIHEGLLREMKEETGLDVTVERLVAVHDLLERQTGDHRVNFWFACQTSDSIQPDWRDPDGKVDQLQFFSQTQVKALPDDTLFPAWLRDEVWEWRAAGYGKHQMYLEEAHDVFPFSR